MSIVRKVKLRTANPPLYENNRTYLSGDIAVGVTTVPVLSTMGFTITGTVDYAALIGAYGEEKSEIVTIDANGAGTNTTGFTTTATKYAHEGSTPLTFIPFNQIKIYGMTTSGGTKTLIATIDIDCSQQATEYIYEGDTYLYFVTTYSNSIETKESGYSDEYSASSFGHNSVNRIIKSGLRKAGTNIDENADADLSWDVAMEILQDGIDEIISRKKKWPFLHKIDSTTTSTISGTAYVSIPDDCLIIETIKYDGKKIPWISPRDYNYIMDTTATPESGEPVNYTIKNNKIYLRPVPNSVKSITYEYYYTPADISSLATDIPQPFVAMLTYYCGSMFASIRRNTKVKDDLYKNFGMLLEQQVEEYTGAEQIGDAEYVEFTAYADDPEYKL